MLKQFTLKALSMLFLIAVQIYSGSAFCYRAEAEEPAVNADLDKSMTIVLAVYEEGKEERNEKDKLHCRFMPIHCLRGHAFGGPLRLKIDMALVKPYRTSHERYFPHSSVWILYLDWAPKQNPVIQLTKAPGALVLYSDDSLRQAVVRANDGQFDKELFDRLKVYAETSEGVIVDPKQFESRSK